MQNPGLEFPLDMQSLLITLTSKGILETRRLEAGWYVPSGYTLDLVYGVPPGFYTMVVGIGAYVTVSCMEAEVYIDDARVLFDPCIEDFMYPRQEAFLEHGMLFFIKNKIEIIVRNKSQYDGYIYAAVVYAHFPQQIYSEIAEKVMSTFLNFVSQA